MKVNLSLKNCFGIQCLQKELDFRKSQTNIIYAPNGTMKSSLAKTFKRLSEGKKPEDMLYKRDTYCSITINDQDINSGSILVIEPFNSEFESDVTTLLLNKDKKKEYNKISKEIHEHQKKIISILNTHSGVKRNDIIEKIENDTKCTNIYEAISYFQKSNKDECDFNIKYFDIFNEKTEKLLSDDNFKKNISLYSEKYNELIERSRIYKKSVFNEAKALTILNELEKNNYFDAEHSLNINGLKIKIENAKQLKELIETEKNQILSDEELISLNHKYLHIVPKK